LEPLEHGQRDFSAAVVLRHAAAIPAALLVQRQSAAV
jgi:hypothetical protein